MCNTHKVYRVTCSEYCRDIKSFTRKKNLCQEDDKINLIGLIPNYPKETTGMMESGLERQKSGM